MGALLRPTLATLIAIALAFASFAQQRPVDQAAPNAANGSTSLTGKERLGRKWMDEQRIDNCNVPVDKRGARTRPGICAHTPSG
jgi:ABC-type microcin C transport system permease subunit YejB